MINEFIIDVNVFNKRVNNFRGISELIICHTFFELELCLEIYSV